MLQKHHGQEQAAKPAGIGGGGDGGIGLDRGDAKKASALLCSFANTERDVLVAGESGLHQDGGSQRVPGKVTAGGDGICLGAEQFDSEPGGGVQAECLQAFEVRERNGNLVGGIEANDAKRPVCAENGLEGQGIKKRVPFRRGCGGHVAGDIERAAHPDEIADGWTQARLLAEGEGEIREGAESEDVERGAPEEPALQIGRSGLGWQRGMGGGQLAKELVRSLSPCSGKSGGILQGPGGAHVDRNAGAMAVSEQPGDRLGASGWVGKAVNNGDGFDPNIRALQQKKNGQQIVGAGVSVNQHRMRRLRKKAGG